MNWKNVKEKFPKSYDEFRNHYFNEADRTAEDRSIIVDWLRKKGFTAYPLFINDWREYERSLTEKAKS